VLVIDEEDLAEKREGGIGTPEEKEEGAD